MTLKKIVTTELHNLGLFLDTTAIIPSMNVANNRATFIDHVFSAIIHNCLKEIRIEPIELDWLDLMDIYEDMHLTPPPANILQEQLNHMKSMRIELLGLVILEANFNHSTFYTRILNRSIIQILIYDTYPIVKAG